MRKIIIISDVHLSNTKSYSWFNKATDAANLARFLHRTANDSEVIELVLLGDIFDLWLYPPSVTPLNVQQIIGQWGDVISALRECVAKLPNVYYVKGNHDMEVTASDVAAISSGGKHVQWITHDDYNNKYPKKLHVEHGNDADMFNMPPPLPVGYLITRMAAAVDRVVSFFDLWGDMKTVADRHRLQNNRLMDDLSVRTRAGAWSAPNDFVRRRLELEARSTAMSLELERMSMIDEMIEHAATYSSVNSSEPFTMPDGKKISIDELKNQAHMHQLHMSYQPDPNEANLDWSLDHLRAVPTAEYRRNFIDSALAVMDLDWYAKEVLQRTSAKVVVMGHTHKAAWKFINKGWYANSGCWCERNEENPPTYVTVFMQDEPSVEVVKYGGDNKPDQLIPCVPL